MSFRVHPLWWPLLLLGSPVLVPALAARNRRFKANQVKVEELNKTLIDQARPLDLPVLESLELTVIVEEKTTNGFLGDAGVSYLFKSDQGSLLYDVAFGPERPALAHNARKLGIAFDQVDALAISHLHPDHMGGMRAQTSKQVKVPEEMGLPGGKHCYLPSAAGAAGFEVEVVREPRLLTSGWASTGPLARSLFFLGLTEEQALVGRLKDKGLVVFTGCGHPTVEVILRMVRRLSDEPIHALGGGLHFPVTSGRGNRLGLQFQQIIGTGKPPWQRITDADVTRTIRAINEAGPSKVYLSAHDTCDHALARLGKELDCETRVLQAGQEYQI